MIKQLRAAIFENGTRQAKEYADELFNSLAGGTGIEATVVNVYDARPCTQVLPVRAIPNVAVLLFADTLEEGQEILDVLEQINHIRNQDEIQAAGTRLLAEGVTAGTVDGTKMVECKALLRPWRPGAYQLNDSRMHDGQPWRCCQEHSSLNNPDIIPGASPAHWVQYHTKDPARALPFVQPSGAHDTYQTGECMVLDGIVWRSTIDNNAYSPEAYPQGWETVEV